MSDTKQPNFEDVDLSTISNEIVVAVDELLESKTRGKGISKASFINTHKNNLQVLMYLEKEYVSTLRFSFSSGTSSGGLIRIFSLLYSLAVCSVSDFLDRIYCYGRVIVNVNNYDSFKNIIEFLMSIRNVKSRCLSNIARDYLDKTGFNTNASFTIDKIIKMLKQLANVYGNALNGDVLNYMYNLAKDMYDSDNIVDEHIYFLLQYAGTPHKLLGKVRDISTGHPDIFYLLLNDSLCEVTKQDISHLSKSAQKIILAYQSKINC